MEKIKVTYVGKAARTVLGVRFEPGKTSEFAPDKWAQMAARPTVAELLQEGVFVVSAGAAATSKPGAVEELKSALAAAADRIGQLERELAEERAKTKPPEQPLPPAAPASDTSAEKAEKAGEKGKR